MVKCYMQMKIKKNEKEELKTWGNSILPFPASFLTRPFSASRSSSVKGKKVKVEHLL